MIYFYFVLFFSILTLFEVNRLEIKQKNYIYFLIMFGLSLAIGLRGNNDEFSKLYYLIPTLDTVFTEGRYIMMEKGPLFVLISSTFKTLLLPPQSMLLFFSFTGIYIHAYYYKKLSKYYYLPFLIYLSHEIAYKELIGARLGLASALLLPMIYYLNKKDNFKFFTLVSIASLIQYIAILSSLLYFINRRFKPIFLWAGLVISIILLESHFVYNTIMQINSLGFFPDIIGHYLNSKSYVYDAGIMHIKTIQQIIIVTVLILFFGYKENNSTLYNLLFNTYYISTIFFILFAELAIFSFRIGGHFYSVEPILLLYFIYAFRQKVIVANLIVICVLIVSYINYVIIERVRTYETFINYSDFL